MSELSKETLLLFLRDIQNEISIHHGVVKPSYPKKTAGEVRLLHRGMFSLAEEIIHRFDLEQEPRHPS